MAKVIFSKDAHEFVKKLADALKKVPQFKVPEWAMYVKSGVSKERPPADKDFWFIRSASILRQLYIHGVVGVERLRTRYGSKKNRGGKPSRFKKSSGKIIRVILQQAEEAGIVEKLSRLQFGRRLTQSGRDFLDSIEVEEKSGIEIKPEEAKKPIEQEQFEEDDVKEEKKEEKKEENKGVKEKE